MNVPGLYAFFFFKGRGHQGILSLVMGTLWGNYKFVLEHFKGTNAMTRRHWGNCHRCLHAVSGLMYFPLTEVSFEPVFMESPWISQSQCRTSHCRVGLEDDPKLELQVNTPPIFQFTYSSESNIIYSKILESVQILKIFWTNPRVKMCRASLRK